MNTEIEKNTGAFIHLSTLSQYFFPLGNFIIPILIWSYKKEKSEYIDYIGKQVINFQLSILLYSLVFVFIAIPAFFYVFLNNINFNYVIHHKDLLFEHINLQNNFTIISIGVMAIFALIILKAIEFFLIIYAVIKTSNSEYFKYPLTIRFLK